MCFPWMNSQRDMEKVFQELLASINIVTEIYVDAYVYHYSEIIEFIVKFGVKERKRYKY